MKNRRFFFHVILLLFSLYTSSPAQNLVQDTLTIAFDQFPKTISAVKVDTVIDARNVHPRLLAEYEQTKYLFIPVDLLVLSANPLDKEIRDAFNHCDSSAQEAVYKLTLDEFELGKREVSLFYPHYQLYASVHLQRQMKGKAAIYLGQLLYEIKMRKPLFGDKLKKGFEAVSQHWLRQLVKDVNRVAQSIHNKERPGLQNFRQKKYYGRSLNMISGIDFHTGSGDLLWDGEIQFSRRETQRRFYRDGYNIRYRRSKKYESIEFGISGDYLYYRLNENFLLRCKSLLMFGFSSWNDLDETRHKLWDAFIGDYTLSQTIIYNPLDKSSILFGLGISQDVFYIYSKKINFRFSLLINLGLKL